MGAVRRARPRSACWMAAARGRPRDGARASLCRFRPRASRSSPRRSCRRWCWGSRHGAAGGGAASPGAFALGVALAAPVLVLLAGQSGQRARARLRAGRRARPLDPSVLLAPDGDRRPLRRPRRPARTLVGPELLSARLSLRPEPLPRGRHAGARRRRTAGGRPRPPAALLARSRLRGRARPLGRAGALVEHAAPRCAGSASREGFLLVHLAVALLAGLGLQALAERPARRGCSRRSPAASRLLARGDPAASAGLPEALARFALGVLPAGIEPRSARGAPAPRAARTRRPAVRARRRPPSGRSRRARAASRAARRLAGRGGRGGGPAAHGRRARPDALADASTSRLPSSPRDQPSGCARAASSPVRSRSSPASDQGRVARGPDHERGASRCCARR